MEKGHSVTVVSSDPEKQKDIEALGGIAAVGTLEDADFLAATFTGADAVYSMVPPNNYFDQSLDLIAYYRRLGKNYAQAVRQSGVKRVVNLSTIGGNLEKGNGILRGAHDVENTRIWMFFRSSSGKKFSRRASTYRRAKDKFHTRFAEKWARRLRMR